MKAKTFWIYRFLKIFLHNFSFPTLYIYINTEYWPEYSFNWCKENISGISFIYVSADVKNHSLLIGLEKHYQLASTVPGTRSYHCFIPTCTNELQLKRISANPYHCNFRFGKTKTRISLNDIKPGQYYVYMYDDDRSIGIVHLNIKMSISNFQKKSISNNFSWPLRLDVCWIPITDIICKIESLKTQENTATNYKITQKELNKITNLFINFYEWSCF